MLPSPFLMFDSLGRLSWTKQVFESVKVELTPIGANQRAATPRRSSKCVPNPATSKGRATHVASQNIMTRESRPSRLLAGLTCLLTLQLPLVSAQVAGIEKAANDSLLWGPYRPNLYFGVRPRIPKSLMGGLMWTRVEDYSSVQNSRFVHILSA